MRQEDIPYGYVIDNRIRDKFHQGFTRSDLSVTHFVIHGTGGGNTAEGNIKWMLSGGLMPNGHTREAQYKKGQALFQLIADRDGKIIELINPHNWVYHSSTGRFDLHTIGIELTNPDRSNGGFYTEKQYQATACTYLWLSDIFPNMTTIQGHGTLKQEKTGSGKACPGTGFDWIKFNSILIDNGAQTRFERATEKIIIVA
jgi:hypothetical protein